MKIETFLVNLSSLADINPLIGVTLLFVDKNNHTKNVGVDSGPCETVGFVLVVVLS